MNFARATKMRLTNREKFISSCINPYFDNFATKVEVRAAKLKARGRFWYDSEFEEFVSFSPTGRREFFSVSLWYNSDTPEQEMNTYYKEWKRIARKAALLWSQGNYKKSNNLVCLMLRHRYQLVETKKL